MSSKAPFNVDDVLSVRVIDKHAPVVSGEPTFADRMRVLNAGKIQERRDYAAQHTRPDSKVEKAKRYIEHVEKRRFLSFVMEVETVRYAKDVHRVNCLSEDMEIILRNITDKCNRGDFKEFVWPVEFSYTEYDGQRVNTISPFCRNVLRKKAKIVKQRLEEHGLTVELYITKSFVKCQQVYLIISL